MEVATVAIWLLAAGIGAHDAFWAMVSVPANQFTTANCHLSAGNRVIQYLAIMSLIV